jgi:hypothetical protein
MEDQGIGQCQFGWIHHNLIGIVDRSIDGDTPGFVMNYAFAVFTSSLCAVSVAVIPSGGTVTGRHRTNLSVLDQAVPRWVEARGILLRSHGPTVPNGGAVEVVTCACDLRHLAWLIGPGRPVRRLLRDFAWACLRLGIGRHPRGNCALAEEL